MCLYHIKLHNTWNKKCIELHEETDKSKFIVVDSKTSFSTSGRTTKQKISKDLEALNNTVVSNWHLQATPPNSSGIQLAAFKVPAEHLPR